MLVSRENLKNNDTMGVVSSLRCLGICFSNYRLPSADVKLGVSDVKKNLWWIEEDG